MSLENVTLLTRVNSTARPRSSLAAELSGVFVGRGIGIAFTEEVPLRPGQRNALGNGRTLVHASDAGMQGGLIAFVDVNVAPRCRRWIGPGHDIDNREPLRIAHHPLPTISEPLVEHLQTSPGLAHVPVYGVLVHDSLGRGNALEKHRMAHGGPEGTCTPVKPLVGFIPPLRILRPEPATAGLLSQIAQNGPA